jgi:tRNA pseudouridine38-40 synthase
VSVLLDGLINIKLLIEFNGKNYFGWQRQKIKPSIQQTIEESLQVLFPQDKIKLIGAGRTDTGVHAYGMTANFKIADESLKIPLALLQRKMNSILPDDITILKVQKVSYDFHARYSAKIRCYKYYLSTRKVSIDNDKIYYIKTKFDIDLAKEFCKLLVGIHSFRSLCKNEDDKHDFLSEVFSAEIKKKRNSIYEFTICANRFLHSMVRAIIGAMIKIASGKLELTEFQNKFNKGEQLKIQYVPANALFLYKITY